jgi:hypothetical protein
MITTKCAAYLRSPRDFCGLIRLGPSPLFSDGTWWWNPVRWQTAPAVDFEVLASLVFHDVCRRDLCHILETCTTTEQRSRLFPELRTLSQTDLIAQQDCFNFLESLRCYLQSCDNLRRHLPKCPQIPFYPVLDTIQVDARVKFIKWLQDIDHSISIAEGEIILREQQLQLTATQNKQ